jgi:hypothetical protein
MSVHALIGTNITSKYTDLPKTISVISSHHFMRTCIETYALYFFTTDVMTGL